MNNALKYLSLFLHSPLKNCVILFFIGDLFLMLAGSSISNIYLTIAGLLGTIGNAALLIGGDGRANSFTKWQHTRFFENAAFMFFTLASVFFVWSALYGFEGKIIISALGIGIAEFLGSFFGLVLSEKGSAKGFTTRFSPYQVSAFFYFLLSLSILFSYFETGIIWFLWSFIAFLGSDVFLFLSKKPLND